MRLRITRTAVYPSGDVSEAPIDGTRDGAILEFDPPWVYAFQWNTDVLRFELVPDGDGCRLYFSQTLGGGSIGRLGAARNAAGWDHCLGSLCALLDGREVEAFTEWVPAMEHYIAVFGLDEGELTETPRRLRTALRPRSGVEARGRRVATARRGQRRGAR